MVGDTEESLLANGIPFVVGRANYLDTPRGEIVGERIGFLKLLFHKEDMRLLGVHVIGEHATELAHLGLLAMLMRAGSELFEHACFNLPTLGDLYRIATYRAVFASHRGGKAKAAQHRNTFHFSNFEESVLDRSDLRPKSFIKW